MLPIFVWFVVAVFVSLYPIAGLVLITSVILRENGGF